MRTYNDENLNSGTEELTPAKIYETLTTHRRLTEFVDWCETIKGVKFSTVLPRRIALQPADKKLTPRQNLCIQYSRDYIQSFIWKQTASNFS